MTERHHAEVAAAYRLLVLKRWAAWPRGTRWVLGGIAGVVVVLAAAWVLLVPVADWLATHDVGSVTGPPRVLRLQTARDAARGRLLTLGAGLFAVGALVYTARNFTLSREGQVTDRYTKAIEQLGSKTIPVRTGGIYALERVARDSARDQFTVIEVLAAFVRDRSRKQRVPKPGKVLVQRKTTSLDLQAAVTVIGRRNLAIRQRIDLAGANLPGAILTLAELGSADLGDADLSGADLTGVNLAVAKLSGAKLAGANLSFAYRSSIGGSSNGSLDLTPAQRKRADSIQFWFVTSYMIRADLTAADLSGADLTGANLSRTKLASAKLDGANLRGAKLNGTDLTDADLTRADVTGADLTSAFWPLEVAVPEGWQRDADSGRLKRADASSGDATTT